MKVLFVLSQVEVTGAETYALTLAQALKRLGHEVVLVSEKLRDAQGFPFHSLPLHSQNTRTLGRVRNVFALRRLIREEGVDLIHSHSRAANLVAQFARGRAPMVVTVHGRWRNHFAARVLPCLGDLTVAVCPYLQRYLTDDLGIPAERIRMVPNGIDTQVFAPAPGDAAPAPTLLFVGRFSGQKGNVIRYLIRAVFPEVLKAFPETVFRIVSYAPPAPDLDKVREFNRAAGRSAVEIVDWGDQTAQLYAKATAVIGSGRVALEAMACGRPVVAIGESSAPGLLNEGSFESAFDSNFGDCGEWNLFEKPNGVLEDLLALLSGKADAAELGRWGRGKVLARFDSSKVGRQIEEIYRGCLEAA